MKTLVIARHGNTFRPGETPTRVGARTDLPLVEEKRARCIGKYLKEKGIVPNRVYASPLKRTMQTASLALKEAGLTNDILVEEGLKEIDYGPDENKTEEEVIFRLGKNALEQQGKLSNGTPVADILAEGERLITLWNTDAVLPKGWLADVNAIRNFWKNFADNIADNETVFVVSSNGTIRFAPCILNDEKAFQQNHDIKTPTGGVCVFENDGNVWKCVDWNIKPFKMFDIS